MFTFGSVVVVEDGLVGVVVKCWGASDKRGRHYEVYVRSYCVIQEFDENEIKHYIFCKELSKDELEYYE